MSTKPDGDARLTDGLGTRRRLLDVAREVLAVASAVLIVLSARSSLADHYHVPSGSMEPTIEVGDRLFVNKVAYEVRLPFTSRALLRHGDPAPGDVVVLADPDPGSDQTLVKRVVAVPGDEVVVRGGQVWRWPARVAVAQNAPMEHRPPPVSEPPKNLSSGPGPDFGPTRLPADHYLVMGDHRGNSRDGRTFGLVERRAISGRVKAVYRRQGRFTWLPDL